MKTVIEMAREAGLITNSFGDVHGDIYHLERFAAQVREDVLANEREKQQEPVAWMKNQFITDDAGFNIGTDDPEVHFGKDCPEDSGWWPVYAETISTQKPVVFRYKEYPLDTRSSWHYVTKRKAIPDGFPFQELYTTPPTAAIAARAMRDAAVKVCREISEGSYDADACNECANLIESIPVAEVIVGSSILEHTTQKPVPEVPLPKTLEGGYELCEDEGCPHHGTVHYCRSVPEVQWRDLTDDDWDEIDANAPEHLDSMDIEAMGKDAIAKFKEKQL